jgi:hypothetical protein
MAATKFIFQDEFQFSRQEHLRLKRLQVSLLSAGGWHIGERFDDRYNTVYTKVCSIGCLIE